MIIDEFNLPPLIEIKYSKYMLNRPVTSCIEIIKILDDFKANGDEMISKREIASILVIFLHNIFKDEDITKAIEEIDATTPR
jgi:hypothetical protein